MRRRGRAVKSLARNDRPACFISYAWGVREHEQWVEKKLARDLHNAGVEVVLDRWDNASIGSDIARFLSLLEDTQEVRDRGRDTSLPREI